MRMPLGLALVFSVSALCSFGCSGGGNAKVHGVLLENGKPIQLAENEEVSMSFQAVKTNTEVDLASVNFDPATATFTVVSPLRDGIPPGEYKIIVACNPYQQDEKDRFSKAFSADKTPLRINVSDASTLELEVDVGKKSVTKK